MTSSGMPKHQLTAETKQDLKVLTKNTIVQLAFVLEILPLLTSQTTYLTGPQSYNQKIVCIYV
jgi:hypothetical protein